MKFGEHNPQRVPSWKYAACVLMIGLMFIGPWLLVVKWKRVVEDFQPKWATEAGPSNSMILGPLIAGKDRARVGELVYLSHVLLTRGPVPKAFFLVGSHGTQILTLAQGGHVSANSGQMMDVRGTFGTTPAIGILRRQWKLNSAVAIQVSEVPIYIEPSFIRESGD